jgi:hypothetical protein
VLQKTRLPGRPELSFNLEITGPISHYLNEESAWQGVSGDYTITLGENFSAPLGAGLAYPAENRLGALKTDRLLPEKLIA